MGVPMLRHEIEAKLRSNTEEKEQLMKELANLTPSTLPYKFYKLDDSYIAILEFYYEYGFRFKNILVNIDSESKEVWISNDSCMYISEIDEDGWIPSTRHEFFDAMKQAKEIIKKQIDRI